MKRIFYISVLLTLCCLPMAAQLNGTGYYRFRNAQNTSDYISMTNDKFNYNTIIEIACGGLSNATSSEGKARALDCAEKYLKTDIHMVADPDIINPASVIYAKKKNTNNSDYDYNLIGQGTSLLTLTQGKHKASVELNFDDRYVTIEKVGGSGAQTLYTAKIELKSSTYVFLVGYPNLGTRYLVDNNGFFSINESSSNTNAKWYIEPVNYFNVVPEFGYGDKFYTTLYVPFAFKLSGQVENAYVVKSISTDGLLELENVATNGETVPAGTPVLLECLSDNPTDCQLIPQDMPLFTEPQYVVSTDAPAASTATNYEEINLLQGNYYSNTDGDITIVRGRNTSQTFTFNVDHYTGSSDNLFVLGITSSGKLGMVKSTDVITGGNPNAMPANKAWIEYSGSAELVFPFTVSTLGDVNRDGNIDVLDILAVINIIRDRADGFDYDYDAADVDGSGDYSVLDINGIINIIRGR